MAGKNNFKNKLLEDIKKNIANKNYNSQIYKKALNIIINYLKNENLLKNKKFISLNYNYILNKALEFIKSYNYDLENLINNSLENRKRRKLNSKIISFDTNNKKLIIDLNEVIGDKNISDYFLSNENIFLTEIDEAKCFDINLKIRLEIYSIENTKN